MKRDNTAFRDRFQRWKNGELVYENGRVIPHYESGSDGIVLDNTRIYNPREQTFNVGKLITNEDRLNNIFQQHYSEVKPSTKISLIERDINRQRAETKQWNLNKKQLELATDLMMIGMLDPRLAIAGFGVGLLAKGIGAVVKAGKGLYNSYKISKAIDKTVSSIKPQPEYASAGSFWSDGVLNFKNYLIKETLSRSKKELETIPAYNIYIDDLSTINDVLSANSATVDVFNNSVLPRLLFMRPGYRGGLMYPTIKSRVDVVLDRGYTVYPELLFNEYKDGKFAGFYYPESGHIAIKRGLEGFALGHEYRHRLDRLLNLTEDEELFLSDAYGSDFVKNLPQNVEKLKDINMFPERVTTNFDARNKLLGDFHSYNTDWRLLNKIIDAKSDDEIFKAVENANGYGKAYIELLRNQNKLTPYLANSFRKAMLFVGEFSAPAVLSKPLFTNDKR